MGATTKAPAPPSPPPGVRPDAGERSRSASSASASSSPEPEENYAHRANRAASPGGGPPERWPKSTTTRKRALKRDAAEGSAPPRYDRDAAGTFPPRVLRNWTERFGRMRAMPEGSMDDPERAPGEDPETGTAFGWVPADASEAAHFVRPRTAELPVRETTSAALETFDDPELEPAAELIRALARGEGPEALALIETRLRSPAEEPGEASGAPGVGAASRYFTQHGEFAWAPCRVLSYDAEARLFEIAWTADLGVKKRVKRLNLVFDAESKGAFRTRLANATTLRDAHEARLRYFSLVERMTFDGDVDAVLTPEWVDRVCEKSGRGVVRKRPKASLEAVVDEIRREYARSIKRSVLDLTLADGEAAKRVKRDVNVAPVEPPARVPEVGVADPREGLREEGATAPSEPFALKVSFVEALLPTADAGYLAALQKVYRDLDARDAALLPRPDDPDAFPPAQPMTLRELETFQRSKLEETASTVAENLVVRVCATVTELEEKTREAAITAEDPEARDAHLRALDRMPRFVNQLHLTVVDQLRTVVTNACASAKSFWTESFGGGDAAKEASERHAFHTPLLRVTLVAADGEVRFDPPLETVRDTVLAVFDDAVRAAEGLEDIRGRLAARRAAADPLLTDAERASVARPLMKPLGEWPEPDSELHELHELAVLYKATVADARDAIRATLEENFPGPEKIAERYRGFDELTPPKPEPERAPSEDAAKGAAEDGASAEMQPEAVAREEEDKATAEGGAGDGDAGAAPAEAGGEAETVAAEVAAEEEEEEEEEPAELTLPEIEDEAKRLAALAETVEKTSLNFEPFRMIGVSCVEIKATLAGAATAKRDALLQKLASDFEAACAEASQRFSVITDRLAETCKTPEELDALRQFADGVEAEMAELEKSLAACVAMAETLQRARVRLPDEVVDTYWSAVLQPVTMPQKLAECDERRKEWKKTFVDELKADVAALQRAVADAKATVAAFVEKGDFTLAEDRLVEVQAIEETLAELKRAGELYQSRETLFERPVTNYPALMQVTKEFAPYANLWRTCAEFGRALPRWMTGPFAELDAEKTQASVEAWTRGATKALKSLKSEAAVAVGEELKAKLGEFGAHVPLIVALRNPGLRERHWQMLGEKLGFPVKVDANFSLAKAISMKLHENVAIVEEQAEHASKEFSLERTLDQMLGNWEGVRFETMPWRNTGTSILKGSEDTQMLLDDQIVKTQSMRSSPHIGPFEDRVKLWEKKLTTIQEVLDEWMKMQAGWLYLEPIFGSDDIMQQMPTEGRKFQIVNTTWKRLMTKLEMSSEVLVVGSDEELLAQLHKCNELLDEVNKGLSDYLETKRLAFPRFYFLSDPELLEILSETKDPLRVQPFLKKVFEAIDELEFQKNLEATAMISEEKERVEFKKSFNPKTAGGAVEKWLTECEAAQRETVADQCKKSSDAYATSERTDWMVEWPGQVVLCIGSLYWTSETEHAIVNGTLAEHAERCGKQLMDIVEKVRGKLTKLERKTLSALVVIEVHARDVVEDMKEKQVPNPDDFEWASQLRYTWDENDTGTDRSVTVRMINAAIPYGNEYLGNSSRLVITPLTDRCYRTLMGAVHLDVGGAPEGPAGTGKTETTKDLAKAIAMQCVVFNCSDGLDYLAMAKFFKGLAASGAWACFDEFNRIDLEVLSVIAQQILTITRAKAARALVFDFEGTRLPLRRTCNVFITMNPGYAGRSELPDNLKALFRTVAMMVPDYALISEILLYSNGYLDARSLAIKLVATYKLCSEQLSSQSHYDYGMRAVISVLRAAGAVKLKFPDQDESISMLTSLKDVNLPKFLAPDVPLFNNILNDLFPGVELPAPDYDHMTASLTTACAAANLQPTPKFLEKIFQLYEMILVRHGLMLVGFSYGAKTSMWRMLAEALRDLHSKGLLEENKVKVVVINPKSIYMGQLYGQSDPVSKEWQDGILAKKFRTCAEDKSPDRKWVMFDGPVDAIWIENMNTVLDDNKKLCLNSGEIIQMSSTMNMIFEVQDLAVASPATVSRCGMIYVEPTEMGWEPLQRSWMNTLPEAFGEEHRERLEDLFEWLVEPCLRFVRKNCKELIPTSDINLPFALMNIFESLMDPFRVAEGEEVSMNEKEQRIFVDCAFVFSIVWSIGGTTENAGRKKFDDFLRRLVDHRVELKPDRKDFDLGPGLTIVPPSRSKQQKLYKSFPSGAEGTVYDLVFVREVMQWKNWLKTVESKPVDEKLEFQDIVVTTIDTVRYRFLFDLLVGHGKHVLFGGPTGTGKTVYIKQSLDEQDRTKWQNIQSTFSAQTSANQIQDIIDSKIVKRRKGVYGPPFGMKAIVFIDDLNMPELEEYGAQPPIELLRQWFDYKGWYDRDPSQLCMRQIDDTQFCAAMGPPGGGRNPVTPRLLRHFNQISVCDFDDASLTRVYSAIVDWWARRSNLPLEVVGKTPNLVKATLEIYNTIKKELLPTPSKSHYTYNMRDLSKVWQGVSMVAAPPQDINAIVRLWSHETLRVFHDRLVDDKDRLWFFGFLKQMVERHLGLKFDKVFAHLDADENGVVDIVELRKLMFADFVEDGAGTYEEVTDIDGLLVVVEENLEKYNAEGHLRMDLCLFLYAAEHICRISRVIRQNLGNALLVGVGGSGRQSLTRIAAYMAYGVPGEETTRFRVFGIEISKTYGQTEWREDLKTVLRRAGAEGQPTVFLFSDTQIKLESFLEDINNILNTGEVPNLFAKDETAQIVDAVQERARKAGLPETATKAEYFKFFVAECRRNLHLVLCFSPVGDAFRERLRKFPSLVNCCTIDWFSEWPSDALQSVASQFLSDVSFDAEETRVACIDACQMFHTSVRDLAVKFLANQGRHYYVTPTSYLELIGTYKTLLGEKRTSVSTLRTRYESGLAQIFSAEEQVETMKQELIEKGPKLEITKVETEAILVEVNKETEEASKVREVVAKDEAFAAEKAGEANRIKEECEAKLAEAQPILDSAVAALDTIDKKDISVMAKANAVAPAVALVFEAVCTMNDVKPAMEKDPAGGLKKIPNFFPPAKQLLGNKIPKEIATRLKNLEEHQGGPQPATFENMLKYYPKEDMHPGMVRKVAKMVNSELFDIEKITKINSAAAGIAKWVEAIVKFDEVTKAIAPLEEAQAKAEADASALNATLAEKRAILKDVEDKLQGLNDKLKEKVDLKAELEYDMDQCEKKLVRAEKLIGGLGGEKERWKDIAAALAVDYANLTGDVLLCAGYVAYLGAFTLPYREEVLEMWTARCRDAGIPCGPAFKLAGVLGDPVKIREWTIDGLPNDSFSIDNAIVMSKSRRWPLFIDPQAQANKWIRSMEKSANLVVIKLTDGDYVRRLENAIQYGIPVLLENVGEELDPTLEPLLLKSLVKQGSEMMLKLGEEPFPYNADFRFYITTKLRNPHYLPETSVKVTLLNMMITIDGLTDQLLGIAVARERPDLEEEKVKLVMQGAENSRQLKEVEDKIIEVLGSSETSILDSETAIDVISSAKELSDEITVKQAIAERTEKKIDQTRMGYRPVAVHVAHLFFNVGELCNIEPMYQYSLAWYVNLFNHAIEHADPSDELDQRLDNLIDFFTYSLYKNICRSLFEKDKLLFSFTLAATIFGYKGTLDPTEYRFLLTGGLGQKDGSDDVPCAWLSEKLWLEMLRLSDLPSFGGPVTEKEKEEAKEGEEGEEGDAEEDPTEEGPTPEGDGGADGGTEASGLPPLPKFCDDFRADPSKFQHIYDSATPESEELPEPWRSRLDSFQRLLVLRTIRPDKLTRAVYLYVEASMGSKFIEPPPFDLEQCYADSTCVTPLVFVLSPGSDPMEGLLKYSEARKVRLESLSLGQGQGAKAEKLIEEARGAGSWVVLQNCHLAVSWMTTLDRICEEFVTDDEPPAETFRLWLTSYPSPHFPVAVLQNGIKMTNEPPKGLRANMLQSFASDPISDRNFFDSCNRPAEWKKLLVGLAFFHAYIQERIKFGPLGWNIPYGFNDPDLKISLRQLKMFLDEAHPDQPLSTPLKTLVYLVGECNYGGRVTDGHDRRTLMSILTDDDGGPFNVNIMDDEYRFSPSGTFYAPPEGEYEDYLEYFKTLPLAAEPEVFGLHANADIAKDQKETDLLLDSILLTQSSAGGGGGKSKEETLAEVAAQIEEAIPPAFDVEFATYKYPVEYYESMNSVLCQELVRYNRLLTVIHKSIRDFGLALKGRIVMTGDLDALGNAMYDGKIPAMWAKKSYPSLKPLAAYVSELLKRLDMLKTWIDDGAPPMFWITGFFFTHAFLTGVLQNYARKYKLPIDTVCFDFEAMPADGDFGKKPEDGAFCRGVFLEGCKWSDAEMKLVESDPKVLFTDAPVFWFKPTTSDKRAEFAHYLCPIYRTAERRGVLATTGHSSNFVINLTIPSDKPQNHWIKRGVAGLLSLSY